jgi:type I restriction enzyme R subunit
MPDHEHTTVERPAIDQLIGLGYCWIDGAEFAPGAPAGERQSLRDVVLEPRLRAAVRRINPWISDDNLAKVVRDLTVVQAASLIEGNQFIHESLVRYLSYDQDLGKGRKGQTVKVIDFDNPDNNEFMVVSQLRVQGPTEVIVLDLVIFVNGLPLAVIECKSPYITDPMETGIDQLMRYMNRRHPLDQEGAERLFWYNQVSVATYGDQARMGTVSALPEHFLEWKDPYPLTLADLGGKPKSQQTLLAGVFRRETFLDLVRNFVVFDTVDGRTIKKVARYQQFRAVCKAVQRLKHGGSRRERGGIVWHTQGSGKSLTMVFLAAKIRREPELKDHKLVFITDRTALDEQLTDTLRRCQDETVHHAGSIARLKALLRKDSSDLVMGMLQKFQEDDWGDPEVLNASDKIILMVDEAHRGQYTTLGVNINVGLPNAVKIAFTGTPLVKSQKTTNEFGTYIDTYKIDEAVRDGATVQIVYEGRESQTKVTGDSLDRLFEQYFAEKTAAERAEIKRKYGQELAVLEAPKRIEMVCRDLLDHYRQHIQPNGFKAMVVTASRLAAIRYKEALDRLNAPESAVVISGAHNDEPFYHPHSDPVHVHQAIERFKKPMAEDPLSLIIVKDMLLTGFDVPVCQVMYLDRKLTDHTLLQAIARVNRTRRGKFRGYVVDYYGLSDYLQEALEVFSKDDVEGALKPLKDELPRLERRHARAVRFFEGIDRDNLDACVDALEDSDVRGEFNLALRQFLESMDIVMPNPMAAPFIPDLKGLGLIQIRARNRFRPANPDLFGCGEKVRQLIDAHVYSTGVDPKIPPLEVFDPGFPAYVQAAKTPRARASEIEHAIKHHITVHLEQDPEYYRKLSEKLQGIIQAHHEKWEVLVQLLLDFRGTMETERAERAEDLGLTDREYAFYNILRAEVGTPADVPLYTLEDEVRRVNARLVAELETVTGIVDFFKKADEEKRVRLTIKRTLMNSKLPLDAKARSRIVDRFMELARVRF